MLRSCCSGFGADEDYDQQHEIRPKDTNNDGLDGVEG